MGIRENHYATSEEKFVHTTILYGKLKSGGFDNDNDTAIHAVYYDKNFENPVYKDEMKELFLDGVIYTVPNSPIIIRPSDYNHQTQSMRVSFSMFKLYVILEGADRIEE